MVAAAAIGGFALIPGLPKLPFLFIAAIFGAIAWAVRNGMPGAEKAKEDTQAPALTTASEPISEVGVDALELAIGFGLVPLVDGGSGGRGQPRCCAASAWSAARSRPNSGS